MLKKLTIQEMQELAESKGGKCISTKYVNVKIKLVWQCKEGHQWTAKPNNIKSGRWCPYCIKKGKAYHQSITIQTMQEMAKNKEGKCLSKKYINCKTKLKWQCSDGHKWHTTPTHIKNGKWCPICARKKMGPKRLTIEELQEIAKSYGGECLSKEYNGNRIKLFWRCKKGHKWQAKPAHIKTNHWCPYCAGRGKTIKDMQKLAKSKKGKCLSKKYINCKTKLKWQCSDGHKWFAVSNTIKRSWCPMCSHTKKGTLEELQKMAREKKGKCLSKKYLGAHRLLLFECVKKHKWVASPHSIKQCHWCPKCLERFNEKTCRKLFENIFDNHFPNSKPFWLKNPKTGRLLELDGYNEQLKLAFEYNGKQHYNHIPFFHKKRSLYLIKKTDELKRKLCEKHNVLLIQIPYYIQPKNMTKYILKECNDKNINLPKGISRNFMSHPRFVS